MIFKCSIRHWIRRRRLLFINSTLICFALGLFFRQKSSPTKLLIGRTTLTKSCSNWTYDDILLDCTGDPAENYCSQQVNFCDGHLSIYKNLFARTQSIIVQRKFAKGKRLGGENIHDVLNQAEGDEYFRFEKNFLQLPCNSSIPKQHFGDGHLNDIFASLSIYQTCPTDLPIVNETTIAVNRYDYANLYHTITDLYTVYLLCRFFRYDPKSVRILFIDAHPKSNLDIFWSNLFHSYSRLGQINSSSSIIFRELIWSPPQMASEIDVRRNRRTAASFFEDFRAHVLHQFHVDSHLNRSSICNMINIYFLLRKNYVAHPRNPSGRVARQLANENQVIEYLKKKFQEYPSINFVAGHFEQLSLEQQLKIISQTDLLIGIHGAGLTHVLFMQSNRTLVELAPPTWQHQNHFELMATMNKLNYHRCLISDGLPSTAQTIYQCIHLKVQQMCPSISQTTITSSLTSTRTTIDRSQ